MLLKARKVSKRSNCRDIKPENFLLGQPGSDTYNMIYLVDFGLAVPYLDLHGDHLPFKDSKVMTGTAR